MTDKPDTTAPNTITEAENLGTVSECIGFRFRRIQNELSRRFRQLTEQELASNGMFSALALIEANPGISQADLADAIALDRATVVALLDILEEKGWAERKRDPSDRRRHRLHCTEDGKHSLDKISLVASANEKPIRDEIGSDGLKKLLGLLDQIDEALVDKN